MKDTTIYDKCPVHETDHFLLRLVERGDAEDLLRCYSDASAVRLMNSDNCSCDFHFRALNEMEDQIQGWLGAYREGAFIRFSIVDTQTRSAVGTIEMFDKTKDTGILRLDLCSAYERRDYITELVALSTEKFHDAFGVKRVLMKAIPDAAERISALRACGFNNTTIPRGDLWWTWIEGKQVRGRDKMPYGDYFVHGE